MVALEPPKTSQAKNKNFPKTIKRQSFTIYGLLVLEQNSETNYGYMSTLLTQEKKF